MPKSKGDVSNEVKKNQKEGNKLAEEITLKNEKETKGKSGSFSGAGETEDGK